MQDVAAAGQVAAVRQGRPAQVHAAFGPATRWPLTMREETEATMLFPSMFPSPRWTVRRWEASSLLYLPLHRPPRCRAPHWRKAEAAPSPLLLP